MIGITFGVDDVAGLISSDQQAAAHGTVGADGVVFHDLLMERENLLPCCQRGSRW
jgi:hypothetical protein